jgi:hypothetical protein
LSAVHLKLVPEKPVSSAVNTTVAYELADVAPVIANVVHSCQLLLTLPLAST